MRIRSAEIIRYQGEMRESFASARAEWRTRSGLVLVLRDEEGRIGLGEASPLPHYSSDTIEAAAPSLAIAASALRELDLDLELPLLPRVAAWLAAGPLVPPAARFALETALLDLAGQRLGLPVRALITGRSEPALELAAVISGTTDRALADSAMRALERGIRTLKLKIGREPFDVELPRLRALARMLPPGARIRLDANQKLVPDTLTRLSALLEIGPELVEEPAPPEELLCLPSSPVPLALDESLGRADAAELIASLASRGLLGALVLKPMAIGGILRSAELAALARTLGLEPIVSHLLDGPIAHAAASQLALATSSITLAAGLDRHSGLTAWPDLEAPHLSAHQIVSEPGPAGLLGIEDAAKAAWLAQLHSTEVADAR